MAKFMRYFWITAVLGIILALTSIDGTEAHDGNKAEEAIQHRLRLSTSIANAPVYMGKQAGLAVSYRKRDSGTEVIRPAMVTFFHSTGRISRSRYESVMMSNPRPIVDTYYHTAPREEGPYAIRTCVSSVRLNEEPGQNPENIKCKTSTVDVRNLVKDKFTVSGPNAVPSNSNARDQVEFVVRNRDTERHRVLVYIYYSADDNLDKRRDIRMCRQSFSLNGGETRSNGCSTILQDGHYFLYVSVDRSDQTFSAEYVRPATPADLSIAVSESEIQEDRVELDLTVSNPKNQAITYTVWLARLTVIDSPPYLVFEPVSSSQRRRTAAANSTNNVTLTDSNPDWDSRGYGGYEVCVGKVYNEAMKCREISLRLED